MRNRQSWQRGAARVLPVTVAFLCFGIGAGFHSSPARAGAGQQSDQGAPAPQAPGTYALNLQSGAIVNAGPLSEFNSPVLVAWSPDGTKLAVAAAADAHGGRGGVQIVNVASGAITMVASSNQGVADELVWSADSSRLALVFTSQIGSLGAGPTGLYLWRDRDRTIRNLAPSGVRFAAWTPDNNGITAVSVPRPQDPGGSSARLVTFDTQTGDEKTTILSGPAAQCQIGMAWSPDGRYLAYGGSGFHQGCIEGVRLGLWSWEASTGTTRQLFDGTSSAPQWMADGTVLAEVAARGGPTGLLPISLVSFAPDGSSQRALANPIPNMFPPPNPLFETANGVTMYAIAQCNGAAAWIVDPGS